MVWPQGGMSCPVTGCSDKFFNTLNKMRNHYNQFHVLMRDQFACSRCKFYCFKSTEARRHTKKLGNSHLCSVRNIVNQHYINPKDFTLPVIQTPAIDQREVDRLQRLEAAKSPTNDLYHARFIDLNYYDSDENHH
ncbi:hypothetical protein ACF0H5_004712 [Mactra antiquata]